MSDFNWDDVPDSSEGTFVSWDSVGQEVVGVITDITTGTDFNGVPCPQLTIGEGDDESIVTAGQAQLKAKLKALAPRKGQRIKIVYTKKEPRAGGKTLKHFDVFVRDAEQTASVASVAAVPDLEDF